MLDKSIEDQLGALLLAAADAQVPDVIAMLRQTAPTMLAEDREMRAGFEERLAVRWREPFDLYQMILACAREYVQGFYYEHREQAADEQDFTFFVLHRLAVRACRVAAEILCLLRGGFADGAYARWRTLHELTTIAFFITRAGGETAERYLNYEFIESYKLARELNKHAPHLTGPPLPDHEMKALEDLKKTLTDRYGAAFAGENGWASEALRRLNPQCNQTSFEAIERCAGLGHMRPYYKMASHQGHGGPKGAAFTLTVINQDEVHNVGASNAGLAEAGQGACISLFQLLSTLLAHKPQLDWIIGIKAMDVLTMEAANSFAAVQKQLELEEDEERRLRKSPSSEV